MQIAGIALRMINLQIHGNIHYPEFLITQLHCLPLTLLSAVIAPWKYFLFI